MGHGGWQGHRQYPEAKPFCFDPGSMVITYSHLAHLVGACYILQLSPASAHHRIRYKRFQFGVMTLIRVRRVRALVRAIRIIRAFTRLIIDLLLVITRGIRIQRGILFVVVLAIIWPIQFLSVFRRTSSKIKIIDVPGFWNI